MFESSACCRQPCLRCFLPFVLCLSFPDALGDGRFFPQHLALRLFDVHFVLHSVHYHHHCLGLCLSPWNFGSLCKYSVGVFTQNFSVLRVHHQQQYTSGKTIRQIRERWSDFCSRQKPKAKSIKITPKKLSTNVICMPYWHSMTKCGVCFW